MPVRRALLSRPRAEIEERLNRRIALGVEIQNLPRNTTDDVIKYIVETGKWRDYNLQAIKTFFSDSSFLGEYDSSTSGSYVGSLDTHAFLEIPEIQRSVGQQIATLQSIVNRLELLDETSVEVVQGRPAGKLSKVFIVHGHDRASKAEVASFIQKLGFEPIVLHDRPNKGRTLITKFQEEAVGTGFAVVLMTPDDLGKAQKTVDLNPRARQNVVFELGFFIGKLGPERVAALVEGNIEIPSDFDGVVYIPFNEADWQTKLGIELQEAGYEIDWNRVMRR